MSEKLKQERGQAALPNLELLALECIDHIEAFTAFLE
jgi:hypothetical protein